MASSNPHIATFEMLARENSALRWYAIADSAQQSGLPKAVVQECFPARCLFGASQGSPLAHHGPHLVELCLPTESSRTWNWISLNANSNPSVTIIAAQISFDELFVQLAGCIEVVLPDEFEMFLGFWDPAILGTLMGQADDRSLHVQGPVLSASQRSKLTWRLHSWWYWDRYGDMHSLAIDSEQGVPSTDPFSLTQAQVDGLVEACVPDHVLYYVELNQPMLIAEVPSRERYEVVRQAMAQAREFGLVVMNDLVNFVCVTLIYGDKMKTDQVILDLLDQVRHGRLTFPKALDAFP